MGGVPQAAFLSLALPSDLPQKWVDGFLSGLLRLADRYSVRLAGGDIAQSPNGVLADIMVLGSVPAGKAILRSGAKPGDFIYVTGTLGSALATLNRLRDGEKLKPKEHPKHFYPEPRIAVGQYLREKKLASAMIDISDGLSTDLSHICEESKVGAVIYASDIPITRVPRSSHPLARAGQVDTDHRSLTLALHGGDEYELLFTAAPGRRIPKSIAGVPIKRIGEILRGNAMRLATPDGRTTILKPQGWQHFA
jgi:thiamine-monophosphate kinase